MEEIDFSNLSTTLCEALGKEYTVHETHIRCQNLILQDESPSMIIYNSGFALSLNGDINGKNRVSIKEICLLSGRIDLYVEFMCVINNIPSYKLNRYRELILNDRLNILEEREKRVLKSLFGNCYIGENDVRGISYIKPISPKKFEAKRKKKKSEITEREPTETELSKIINYLNNRKLNFSLKIIEPTVVITNGKYENLAVAIRYRNGYTKYRLIDSDLRFLSNTNNGEYCEFFIPSYFNNSSIAIVIEGELNCETISQALLINKIYPKYSLYAMNNLNSLPKGSEQIRDYKDVIVIIDYDKYNNVKDGLLNNIKKYTNGNVIITYTNDENIDFNEYAKIHGLEELTKYFDNKIKNILTK